MAYLLDSDWIIQALGNRPLATSTLHRLAGSRVFISWVTVAEVYQGAFSSPNPQAHLIVTRHFVSHYRVLGLNDPICERFAELRAELQRRGEKIPDFDLLIAATALHYELTVLTFDLRHFLRVPELKVYRPH